MRDEETAHSLAEQLLASLESLEQLEALLVLAQEPGRAYTGEELFARSAVRPEDPLEVMADLRSKELAIEADHGMWRLSDDARISAGVRELSRRYREDPTPIVRALVQRALERARGLAGWAAARDLFSRKK